MTEFCVYVSAISLLAPRPAEDDALSHEEMRLSAGGRSLSVTLED